MTFPFCGLRLAIIGLLIFPHTLQAATPDTLTDSRSTLLQGIQLNDEGKYKEAIALFKTVPEGDTNYAIAINELTLSSLNDSAFADARQYALQGLELPNSPNRRSFMLMLGHAEDYLGHHNEALRWYDSLIARNPYDHQPWYEKGALYLLQDENNKAIACYKHSIMLNPNHFRSHLGIAAALLHQGRLAEAYLPLCFSLFTTGDRALGAKAMMLMDAIQDQQDEIVKHYKARDKDAMDPAFAEADEIIHSKLALTNDYTFESIMAGDATAKTLHAILEKVRYDPADSAVAMQYYLPLFSEALDKGQFDGMLLLMFSGYQIESIEKLAKKHQSDIQDFRKTLAAYSDKIAATQVFNYRQRQAAPEHYALLASDNLFVVGGIRSLNPLKWGQGQITFYKSGSLTGKGLANASGEREGEWTNYHPNGIVSSRETYRNGKPTGTGYAYRENGTPEKEYRYGLDGKVVEERDYTYNGLLESATEQHDGYAEYTAYLPDGSVEYKARLVKGKIQDPVVRVMREGNILATEIHFANGERDGVTKSYYDNGKLSDETTYRSGKREGRSVSYHANGQVHYILNYRDDKLDGPYQEFDENGKLTERGEYHKGRKTGQEESFTPDGRIYGTITYRKDRPVAYQYTDEEGHVLASGDKSSDEGLKVIKAYYANGIQMSEVPLNEEGLADGEASYFYRSGALKRKTQYRSDRREGREIEYFSNGAVRSEVYYKDGASFGMCTGYADNGAKRWQGFLDDDDRCGFWTDFYPNGKPESECFYISGKQNGPERNYHANGRLHFTRTFDKGMVTGLTQYDTNDAIISKRRFPAGNGTYQLLFPNGRPSYEVGVKNGNLDGSFATYFPDGSPREKGLMVRGRQEGDVLVYHPNGTVAVKGKMHRGRREGTWTWYDPAGQPEREMNYVGGDQEGADKMYMAGLLHTQYTYHDGDLDGREILYGDSGRIAAILIYEHDLITGYTYMGKDGKELPVTPLKGGTGHILTYYPNGQKATDYSLKQGVFTGDCMRWYGNGTLAYESHRDKTANLEGVYRRWAPNGQLVYEAAYRNGIMTGTERCWNADGALVYSSEYCDSGDKHGVYTVVDPATGKKASIRYYYGTMMQSL
jgi:antitoxin component YwqK of YwqJK toxin-antitoxin module/tetratricopeptide (TPR) repeat protein